MYNGKGVSANMALQLEHVTKYFGNTLALNDLSMTIPAGDIHALIGPNGAGKTTLMRLILRIITADQGIISWNNQPLQTVPVQSFAYVPEERGLFPRMTVFDQLQFFGRLWGLSTKEARHQSQLVTTQWPE
jgi:ABC-2 type transport system ATP-binding protein